MKIYINTNDISYNEDYNYDYGGYVISNAEIRGYGVVVPDDFNETTLKQEWHDKCFMPKTGKNKHGPYTSKKVGVYSKPFYEYLNDQYGYELLEIIS